MARRIEVLIVGDATVLERTLGKASRTTAAFAKNVEHSGRVAGRSQTQFTALAVAKSKFTAATQFATASILGGTGLIYALQQSVQKAREAQIVNKNLETQVKALGLSYKEHRAEIEKTIKKQSDLSAFSKIDLKSSFIGLLRATKDVNEALKLNALAQDVARGRGVDVGVAAQAVTKAYIGNVGALKRIGILIPQVHTAQDALAESGKKFTREQQRQAKAIDAAATKQQALAILQSRFAGQAKAYGESSAGAADRLNNSLADSERVIGNALLPVLNRGAGALAKWLDHLNKTGELQRDVNKAVKIGTTVFRDATVVVKGLAGVVKFLVSQFGGWENAAKFIIGGVFASKVLKLAASFRVLASAQGIAGTTGALSGKGGLIAAFRALPTKVTIPVVIAVSAVGEYQLLKKLFEGAFGADYSGIAPDKQGTGGNPYPVGTVNHDLFELGRRGKSVPKTLGHKTDKAYKEGLTAAMSATTSRGVVGTAMAAASSPGAAAASFHLPGERKPYDCSAFTQAVFAKNHIAIGGNTYTQYARGRKVNKNDLQPGDLIFFNYPGERSPGHVGIYVGNGMMVHDHGASRGVGHQPVDWGHYVGARCYMPGHVHAGATSGGGGQSLSDLLSQGKSKGGKGSKASPLPAKFQLAIAQAKRTEGTGDDLAALRGAKAYLEQKLEGTSGDAKRLPIVKAINAINTAIKSIQDREAKAKLARIRAAFTTMWGPVTGSASGSTFTDQALAAFDRATDQAIKQHQTGLAQRMKSIDAQLKQQLVGIDASLKQQLAAIDSARAALTPAERALKELQDQHDAAEAAAEWQDAQDSLRKAQEELQKALTGGDQSEIASATEQVKQAQKRIADDLYQQRVSELQKQAEAERQARDQLANDQQSAAEIAADQQRQQLEDSAQAQRDAAQEEYDIWDEAYKNERDRDRKHYEQSLIQLGAYLLGRAALANMSAAQLKAFLLSHPDVLAKFGISPGDIAMLDTDPLGGSALGGGTISAVTRSPGGGSLVKTAAAGGMATGRAPLLGMWGEAGRELFLPLDDPMVTNTLRGLSGGNVQIFVAGSVVTEGQLIEKVRTGLIRHQARNGSIF